MTEYFVENRRTINDLHREIKEKILKQFDNVIDVCFKRDSSHIHQCQCPYCNYDYEVWVIYWKEIGTFLGVSKIMLSVIMDRYEFNAMREPVEQKITDYPEWVKWQNDELIINALNAMQTMMWAETEQTDESWEKNWEVY